MRIQHAIHLMQMLALPIAHLPGVIIMTMAIAMSMAADHSGFAPAATKPGLTPSNRPKQAIQPVQAFCHGILVEA